MTDFPAAEKQAHGSISTASPESLIGQYCAATVSVMTVAAAWPTANLAIYTPVVIVESVIAYQMSIEVGAQAGNVDVGIYDEGGNRLVSMGSQVVGAAGVQVFNITDTTLYPGTYYLAMNVSTVTTATFMKVATPTQVNRMCGVRQQAVGAVTLPNPATFATMGSAYVPKLAAHIMQATA